MVVSPSYYIYFFINNPPIAIELPLTHQPLVISCHTIPRSATITPAHSIDCDKSLSLIAIAITTSIGQTLPTPTIVIAMDLKGF